MELTLYYHPLASYCQKVLIALYERETAFDKRIINLGDEGDRSELVALWPFGKFPVIRDHVRQRDLPESSVIIEYLGLSPRRNTQIYIQQESSMKYLCLVYLSKENWNACPDASCFEFAEALHKSGRMLAAEPLYPVETATTVRVRNGQMTMTDGPFAETKELLAGFYLVDAKDLNEAAQIASQIPPAKYGSIEVRPVRELAVEAARSF